MVHSFKNPDLGLLVSILWTFWEDTHGCSKKYRFAIVIYLITMLLYLYGIIMNLVNNELDHDFFLEGIYTTDKYFTKKKLELIRKLPINDTSNIGMLPSASTYFMFIFCKNIHTSSLLLVHV